MKGAKTEPCATINNPPNIIKIIIIGANQIFFLNLRKDQSSFNISIY